MNSYANIVLKGPDLATVQAWMKSRGEIAFLGQGGGAVVVFHSDLGGQERLAADLSQEFACPALLAMTYAQRVLLYQLYESGQLTDSYVSESHEDLIDVAASPGDPEKLCDAFSRPSAQRRVTTLLGKAPTEGNGYVLAQNRHGELLAALALPTWAAGVGFESIELGEIPAEGVGLVRVG